MKKFCRTSKVSSRDLIRCLILKVQVTFVLDASFQILDARCSREKQMLRLKAFSILRNESKHRRKNGGVAQLGEHLLCKQGVIGSIPFISTTREGKGLNGRETPLTKWAHSSAGQSARLISVRSVVRVHLSPPFQTLDSRHQILDVLEIKQM